VPIGDRRIVECRLPIDGLSSEDWLSVGDWDRRFGVPLVCQRSNCLRPFERASGRAAVFINETVGPSPAWPWSVHPKTIELQDRTRRFAAAVISFCARLPETVASQRITLQLVDSAGSTDSNYRAACRARSKAEFISKLGTAIEEADESKGWLQLLVESRQTDTKTAAPLIQEADELVAIFVRSKKTAEARKAEQDRLPKPNQRLR
jgi:four helix bundle protein